MCRWLAKPPSTYGRKATHKCGGITATLELLAIPQHTTLRSPTSLPRCLGWASDTSDPHQHKSSTFPAPCTACSRAISASNCTAEARREVTTKRHGRHDKMTPSGCQTSPHCPPPPPHIASRCSGRRVARLPKDRVRRHARRLLMHHCHRHLRGTLLKALQRGGD